MVKKQSNYTTPQICKKKAPAVACDLILCKIILHDVKNTVKI